MSLNEKAPLKDETFRSAFSCVFCYKYSKSRDDVKRFVDKDLKINKKKGGARDEPPVGGSIELDCADPWSWSDGAGRGTVGDFPLSRLIAVVGACHDSDGIGDGPLRTAVEHASCRWERCMSSFQSPLVFDRVNSIEIIS